jgi:hypothetical protein
MVSVTNGSLPAGKIPQGRPGRLKRLQVCQWEGTSFTKCQQKHRLANREGPVWRTSDADTDADANDERHEGLMSALQSLPEVVEVLQDPPASTSSSRASGSGGGLARATSSATAGLWNFQFATEDATGLKELVGGTPTLHPDVGAFWKSPAGFAPSVPMPIASAAASDVSDVTITEAAASDASGPAASAAAGSSAVTAMGTPDAGLLYLAGGSSRTSTRPPLSAILLLFLVLVLRLIHVYEHSA